MKNLQKKSMTVVKGSTKRDVDAYINITPELDEWYTCYATLKNDSTGRRLRAKLTKEGYKFILKYCPGEVKASDVEYALVAVPSKREVVLSIPKRCRGDGRSIAAWLKHVNHLKSKAPPHIKYYTEEEYNKKKAEAKGEASVTVQVDDI